MKTQTLKLKNAEVEISWGEGSTKDSIGTAHWAHSSFTGEERRFRKAETIPIGWSAGRAAKATGGAQ